MESLQSEVASLLECNLPHWHKKKINKSREVIQAQMRTAAAYTESTSRDSRQMVGTIRDWIHLRS